MMPKMMKMTVTKTTTMMKMMRVHVEQQEGDGCGRQRGQWAQVNAAEMPQTAAEVSVLPAASPNVGPGW